MWDAVGRGLPRFAAFRRIASRKLARNRESGSSNPLPSHTAERPPVSLAAAAVQARRGPARPEGAVEISRTSETASGFLNCVPGVRVTPGAPTPSRTYVAVWSLLVASGCELGVTPCVVDK